jgi:ribosomal protein S18 acetylase RimI-like enzyme
VVGGSGTVLCVQTPVRISPISSARLPVMASVMARAFADDPLIRWPLPADGDVADRVEAIFAAIYEGIADADVVWEAGDAAGFAVWIPAGSAQDMFESDAAVRDRLEPFTDDGGARYDVLWSWIEERVPDDVWYLDAIGVDPARQGEGIGGALIRFGLERANAEGVSAFLETANPRNVGYYERFGFRVVEEGEPAPGGPHIWFMRTGD